MIHIKLRPNRARGWADKVLKNNLWPINLDTWALVKELTWKASENEIFFVDNMLSKDIPTKLELRHQWFLYTSHTNKLIKWGRLQLVAHPNIKEVWDGPLDVTYNEHSDL